MTTPQLLDHASLPSIVNAPLPATYEAAKRAVTQCAQLDECKMWANKAEALASYARQANDKELLHLCMRIQARAIDRCGEMLHEIEPSKGGRPSETTVGADTSLTRKQAARDAGLSDRQRVTALRVNNVPRDQFEALVESDNPPTVTELAELGTKHQEPDTSHLEGRDPADFERATRLIGLGTYITLKIAELADVDAAIRGLRERERGPLIDTYSQCIDWLTDVRRRVMDGL